MSGKRSQTGSKSGHTPGTDHAQAPEGKGTIARARVVISPKHPPKPPPLARRLYDIEATAAYLGIPPWTVREMIWRGDLPCVRIGRRQYLDIRDVDRFIEQAKQ